MESLKTSIKEFGYITPIIVNKHNNHIVGGNQRLVALKDLGYNEVEVIYINEPDINKEKALNIRLNNNSGQWDTTKLQTILEDLSLKGFQVHDLTGFKETQLSENQFQQPIIQTDYNNDLINDLPEDYDDETEEFKELDDFKEINIDDFTGEHKCPKCGFEWND